VDGGGAYPVMGRWKVDTIAIDAAQWRHIRWTEDGKYTFGASLPSSYDLIPVAEKYERWVNVYKNSQGQLFTDEPWICESREAADRRTRRAWIESVPAPRIACLYLQFHEGDGI
jgi:hypothetical protein